MKAPGEGPGGESAVASEYESTFACITVLTLDDDPTMRAVVGAALRAAGCRNVLQSSNGPRALEMIASQHVDVVLCDCRMEPMDGLTFLQKLRATPRGEEMPVIMLTASSDEADAYRARELKVAAWLVKPIVPASLPRHVAAAIGLAAPHMAEDSLQNLAAAYEASLPSQLGELAEITGRIASGKLGFDENAPDLLRRLHKLKGQAGMLGYPLLGEIAGWLHDLLRPAIDQASVLDKLGPDINRALQVGGGTMLLIAERKLRGDGGAAGARIKDQLGGFTRDLQARVREAVAEAERTARAQRDQTAVTRAEINADRLTLQRMISNSPDPALSRPD